MPPLPHADDSLQKAVQPPAQKPPFWYQLLLQLILPLYRLRVWQRSSHEPDYAAEVQQRFTASYPAKNKQVIWIHAVSLGETNAAQPIIEHFLQHNQPVLVTNTTRTGQVRARELFGNKYPDLFECVFLPIDTLNLIEQLIAKYQPRVLGLIETEIWPNLLYLCRERGIPSILLNARLSARSAQGYEKFGRLTRPMLAQLSLIAAQDNDTAQRFIQLGANPEQVAVTGSVKFDLEPPAHVLQQAEHLKQQWQLAQRQVIVAASTHEPEESIVLDQFKTVLSQFPNALLIVVPRHPQRFERVAELIKNSGFAVVRRSLGQAINAETQVYLADSMGELWQWYALADMAFVGGSLSKTGGHNPLEPARLGVPVVMGPDTFNFKLIVETLIEAGALQQVATPNELGQVWQQWLAQPEQARQIGQQGIAVMQANQGALGRQIGLVERLLKLNK